MSPECFLRERGVFCLCVLNCGCNFFPSRLFASFQWCVSPLFTSPANQKIRKIRWLQSFKDKLGLFPARVWERNETKILIHGWAVPKKTDVTFVYTTLLFHLEDAVLSFATLLLFDPVLFPKNEVCLLIGSIHSAMRPVFYMDCAAFLWIADHAHLFRGGLLFNWNFMISTHTDFGVMISNWIVSNENFIYALYLALTFYSLEACLLIGQWHVQCLDACLF